MPAKQNSVALPIAAVSDRMEQWARTRHATQGNFAVRRASTAYLPMLNGQTQDEYRAYLNRTTFLEATGRTREALTGLIFSREAVIELPAVIEPLVEDATGDGTQLVDFAQRVVDEQLQTGFGGILIAHTGNADEQQTVASATSRPILDYRPAETVLGWRWGVVAGKRVLTQVRLWEVAQEQSADDEFSSVDIPQVRVFDLTAIGCVERIFREVETKEDGKKVKKWAAVATTTLIRNGAPLDVIPFVLVSADGTGEPGHVPLSPLAEINLSHFRTVADYEHALHFCGLPTPYVTGVSVGRSRGDIAAVQDVTLGPGYETMRRPDALQREPALALGSSTFLTLENPNAKLGFLALDPSGVGALRDALNSKENQMATLGASMLSERPANPESGLAMGLRRSAETSGLRAVANAVSGGLSRAAQIAAYWQGADVTAVANTLVQLNTDYGADTVDPALLAQMLAAVNAGRMSLDTFLWNLKRGGLLQKGKSVDDEKQDIEADGPPLGSFGLDQFGGLPNDNNQNGPPNDNPSNNP